MTTLSVNSESGYIDTIAAAKLMSVSVYTLQNWRSRGTGGPPCYKLSATKVVYDRAEVIAWVRQRRQVPAATQLAARV